MTNAASSVSLTGDSHCDECRELGEPNWGLALGGAQDFHTLQGALLQKNSVLPEDIT